jgi:peptidoglycan/LPS O-acetylase OafA/YrhL
MWGEGEAILIRETKYRRDIQVLRGLAVLAVVLFHAKESYFPLGYLGVDVFFVISGFVITPLLFEISQNRDFLTGLKSFYLRRFYRLAPALGSTLVLSALFIYFFGNLNDLARFASQGIASLLVIGNLGALKFSGNYFSPNPNPLVHTWSLSVEEQIYIFLPLTMLIVRLKNRARLNDNYTWLFTFLFSFSFFLFLIPHVLNHFQIKFGLLENSDFFFYFSLSRLWEFLAGSLIYIISQNFFPRSTKWTKALKITSIYSVVAILLSPITLSNAKITPIIILFTVILLVCSDFSNKNKVLGMFSWVGDRSYSIYLVHMPLLYLAKHSPGLGNELNQRLITIIVIVTSILLGHLQFEFVEKKFSMRGQRKTFVSMKLLLRSILGFIGIPMILFGLILASVQMNFKPIVENFSKDSKVDSHLLARAGCVDQEFYSSKCSWNVSSSKGSVLLIGDSQADAASDGVQLAANRSNLNFLGFSASGCPFLQTDTTGGKSINCSRFQSSILKYIKMKKPEFVMIANRTSGYLDPATGWRTFLNSEGKPAKDQSEASKIYSKRLFELSTELKAIGSKVIVFQNIPEPLKVRKPQSIFQYAFLGNQFKNGLSTEVRFNKVARDIEKNLAQRGLIILYDPGLEICGRSCSSQINIGNTFMDTWHLSTEGSLNLSNSIETLFKENS